MQGFEMINSIVAAHRQQQHVEQDIPFEVNSLISKDDQFLAVLALMQLDNQDMFHNLLTVLEKIQTFELQKAVGKALSNSASTWGRLASFQAEYDRDRILYMLGESENLSETDFYSAFQVLLYTSGIQSCLLTSNLESNFELSISMNNVLGNAVKFKSSVAFRKRNQIRNVMNSLVTSIGYDNVDYSVAPNVEKKTRSMIESFDRGVFDTKIIKVPKVSKEAGIALGHSMTPEEWLGHSVMTLVKAVLPLFHVSFLKGDIVSSRNESSYLVLANDEEESPYYIGNHPYFLFPADNDLKEWEWRKMEAEAAKSASIHGEIGAEQRMEAVNHHLREAIHNYSSNGMQVYHDDERATYLLDEKHLVLNFFKRGYSKMEDARDHFDCIHIIPVGQVAEFLQVRSDAVPVTLPDMVSTIMFPEAVWAMADPSPLVDPNNMLGYLNKSASALDGLYKLILLMQLSSAFHFIDSLEDEVPESISAHMDRVCTNLQESSDTSVLPPKGENRRIALEFIKTKVIGGSYGINVVAARSNQGARTSRKLNANSGYITSILQNPMQVSGDVSPQPSSLDHFKQMIMRQDDVQFDSDNSEIGDTVTEIIQI